MVLSQRDPRWSQIKLGNSPYTLGASGCFVTVLAEIIGTTPDIVNKMLFEGGGFAKDTDGYSDLVNWGMIGKIFPGITTRYVTVYNNSDVLQNLANGKSIITIVSGKPIGGQGIHAVRYIGNRRLHDPWTGKERPTSDFPTVYSYVILDGKWQQGGNNITDKLHNYALPKKVFIGLVTQSAEYDEIWKSLNLDPSLKTHPGSHQRVLDYITAKITEARNTVPSVSQTPPVTPPSLPAETPTTQPKSVWKADVLQVLKDILAGIKGNRTN